MDEYATLYQYGFGLVGLVITCFLWMLGGREGKWKRRYLGAGTMALTVNVLFFLREQWSPWFLVLIPLLIAGYSQGYGGDTFGTKIFRRIVFSLGIIASGVFLAFFVGDAAWFIVALQAILCVASVMLGVGNPIKASAEEGFYCLLLNAGLIAYPFVG